jgi:hypothetical protein
MPVHIGLKFVEKKARALSPADYEYVVGFGHLVVGVGWAYIR